MEAKSRTVLFVLSDDVLDSAWCVAELVAAVKSNVKVVLVVKEGARWRGRGRPPLTTAFPTYDCVRSSRYTRGSLTLSPPLS